MMFRFALCSLSAQGVFLGLMVVVMCTSGLRLVQRRDTWPRRSMNSVQKCLANGAGKWVYAPTKTKPYVQPTEYGSGSGKREFFHEVRGSCGDDRAVWKYEWEPDCMPKIPFAPSEFCNEFAGMQLLMIGDS